MSHMEYWVIGQIALEAVILAGVVYFLLRFRKWRGKVDPQEIRAILQDTHLLKDELLDTLQARKAIITNLMKQLDQRVTEAQKILKILERRASLDNPVPDSLDRQRMVESGPLLRERVETLHEQGLPLEKIASQLQISRGEVMLILDLMRAENR